MSIHQVDILLAILSLYAPIESFVVVESWIGALFRHGQVVSFDTCRQININDMHQFKHTTQHLSDINYQAGLR